MATYSPSDLNTKAIRSATGSAVIYDGSVTSTATVATGDVLRLVRVPAGTRVTDIVIRNTDFGTAAPCDIGYTPCDGSSGDDNYFADDSTALNAAGATALNFAPVTLTKDCFIDVTIGTVNTGASGFTATLVVHGMALGAA